MVEQGNYYVIYRRSRTFSSFVLTPTDIEAFSSGMRQGIVIYDDCSYVTTKHEIRAHYSSALLNYLAYKVIEEEGTFVRHQFLRPLIAILHAGLEWRGEQWQSKVAEIGRRLHEEAPKCFANFIRTGMQVKECFERLKTREESKELFEGLMKTVDERVDKERLFKSLRFVCKLRKGI